MAWQPSMNWQNAKKRAEVLTQIRAFFLARNIIEVETPLLSHATVTDVHLDAFITQYNYSPESHFNQPIPLYAQTSPEFAMKRLLASGYGSCYQICKAFRHEQHGRYHNPEFTMLEWYRIGFDHFQLMDEVADLIKLVLGCPKVEQISYQALFLREVDVDPLIANTEQLLALISRHGKLSDWLEKEDSIDTLLQFVMAELIEPNIGKDTPCFVYNFPASQASLAKICRQDSRVAERFECYFKGIELANGFHELTNAEEQSARFNQDNEVRAQLGKGKHDIDINFIAALESGLPTCAGVALGIDRLMMLALSTPKIDEVITFPISNA
jgi:elongation factor P--(R)-beta-lysine ligase